MSVRLAVIAILLLSLLGASARAQSGPQTTQSVIAGGGATSASGPSQVEGTAGQSVTGASAGGSFQLESGFWPAATAKAQANLSVESLTAPYGSTLSLKATLSATGATLSGKSIRFSLNGTNVGTATTDANGLAILNNVSLSGMDAGTYATGISAEFAGDVELTAGNGAGQLTVMKADPVLTVFGGSFIYDGQPHPATISATGVNNEALGPVSLLYNGAINLPVSVGSYAITATFAGNQNYNSATNRQQSIIIGKADQAISFVALPQKTFGDADFTVNATANSGLAVSFAATGHCTINGNTVHLTGAGSCTITASQAGGNDYHAAPPVAQSFSSTKALSATSVTSSTNPSNVGQNVTFTATVSSTAGTPTGTAQLKVDGTNAGAPVALNASGVATFSTAAMASGTRTITVDYNGDGNFMASTATLAGGQVVMPQPSLSLQFSTNSYSVDEAAGHAIVTVTRAGDPSAAASVQYSTSDLAGLNNCHVNTGDASARCDYTAVGGTLNFLAGESSKSFSVPIINDVYVEGPEVLTLTLSNPVGAVLGTLTGATLTVMDNDGAAGAANPIDLREYLVRQFYLDMLNREHEPSGLAAWLDRLNACPQSGETSQNCDEIEVASAFFRSPEFFDRSFFLYKFYEASLGRQPQYDEYQHDLRRLTGFLTSEELEQRKREFAEEFSNRAEFRTLYDSFGSGQPFVDAVLARAGAGREGVGTATIVTANRQSVMNRLGAGQSTRAQALRELMEAPEISQRFFNKTFVVVGYFAFLRRNPDSAYLIWINMLDTTGDYREMIRAFMRSPEYRVRFGPM